MRRAENRVELLRIRVAEVEFQQQRLHAVEMLLSFLEEHLIKLAHVNGHAASRSRSVGLSQ